MARYVCLICGYVHDDAEGEPFGDLPDSWTCPVCGASKSMFEPEAGEAADMESDASAEADASPVAEVGGGPSRALLAHRVFGYLFLAIYLLLIVQMVPRLWSYQIEFPARTVVHISLGMAVGVMLLLKVAIVRYFRRLDQTLVPMLGTSLLVCSVVLIGISVPWAFREAYATAQLFSAESQERVESLLAETGLEASECERYATANSLREGRQVLRQDCIDCHDLRTVMARPRTPKMWRQTVRRMADRSMMIRPLDEEQQWQVTAYLTALSPQLQKSSQQLSEQQAQRAESRQAVLSAVDRGGDPAAYDAEAASALVAAKCSQCHDASLVADAPPTSDEETQSLVASMVDEGMDATQQELELIIEYLQRTYVSEN